MLLTERLTVDGPLSNQQNQAKSIPAYEVDWNVFDDFNAKSMYSLSIFLQASHFTVFEMNFKYFFRL